MPTFQINGILFKTFHQRKTIRITGLVEVLIAPNMR